MRQLAGYILPGAAMLAFGVKWGIQVALEQMEQQQHSYATISSSEASSTSGWSRSKKKQRRGGGGDDGSRSCSWRLRRVPAEGVIKLSITGLGIAASVASAAPSTTLSAQPVGDMLYASIYMFFALSGLADVLVHYCPLAVPSGMDRFVLALAFAIEGLMFHLHLAREAVLEQHVHFLLVVSIYSCASCCLIEAAACSPHPFLWRFARALFTVLHGSWFVHCAFLLHWDGTESLRESVRKSLMDSKPMLEGSHESSTALVWVSLAFAWHCAGALSLLMALMFVCRCCCRRPRRPRDTSLPTGTSSMGVSAPGLTPPLPMPACSRCLPPSQHPHFAAHHPHSLPHPLPHMHAHTHPILPPTPSPQ